MNKILLFIMAALFCTGIVAQTKGKLTFFSQDGEKFWVIINGEKANKEPQYNVKEIPVDFDYGSVKIIFEDTKIPSIDKMVQVVDVDHNYCHVKYKIKKNKKGQMVINNLDATWEIIGKKDAGTSTSSQPPVQQEPTSTPSGTNSQQNTNIGVTIAPTTGGGISMNVNAPTSFSTNNPQTHDPAPVTPAPKAENHGGCATPMSNDNFLEAKKSITSKSFEDSKLTIAKQIAGANCLMTSQVKGIIEIFSFEDSRLEFAKFAFPHTFDKANYYQINDAFKFESSIDEMNQFINSH